MDAILADTAGMTKTGQNEVLKKYGLRPVEVSCLPIYVFQLYYH